MSKKRLFVVDAMALAFRSYHAFARGLSTSDGLPTHAVYGSLMFLLNLLEKEKPDYFVIASDSSEPTFRHKMFDQYKANRTEMPEDLATQIPYIYEAFAALGAKTLLEPGVEADDLIGSLVTQYAEKDLSCYIVSGDKDFMQLIDRNTFMYSPKKGGEAVLVDTKKVAEKFSVKPEQVIDVLALMGDSADNVPGVPGIGEKGAGKLISTYGSLEKVYENLDEIKNKRQHNGLKDNKEQAYLSRELVTIKLDCKIQHELEDFAFDYKKAMGNVKLLELTEKLEFKSLSEKIRQKLGDNDQEDAVVENTAKAHANAHYHTILKKPAWLAFLADWKSQEAYCIDTETTGLNIKDDKPIGFSVSWQEGEAYYIPLTEDQTVPLETIEKGLRQVLSKEGRLKIGHNLKFDMQMLANMGISMVGPFADTMIASYLLKPNVRQHNLDACCENYLDYRKIPTSELISKGGSMLDVELEKLAHYACEDADLTFQLYQALKPLLVANSLDELFTDLEMPLVPILAKMEGDGIYLDKQDLANLNDQLTTNIESTTQKIYDLAGEEFNIRSTKQLQQILFEKLKVHEELGVTRLKKTKSGYSTDASVLERLKEHPLVAHLLDYRMTTKLKSTYVDTLPEMVNDSSGRLHASFHQTGTATGRLSSSDPNLQNIPIRSTQGKLIRKAFKAHSEDYIIMSADYSQIELRVLASLAGEENLSEAFRNDADIHTATAAKIFGVKPEDVSDDARSKAKAINFGIIYGMGPQRLARETGVSQKEAKDFIQKYFDSYPKIKGFIDSSIEFAKEHEYTMTICKRRRPLPEINGNDRMAFVNAQNMAVNTPVQGSAADLIKLAMIKLQERLASSKLDARILLQVHDELVLECHKQHEAEVRKIVKDSMETAMDISVPLKVSIGVGENWLEAH